MCRAHWFLVPGKMQQRVNDSVWKRRSQVDDSWADWWQAKTDAIAAVLRATNWRDEAAIVKFEVRGATLVSLLEGSEH